MLPNKNSSGREDGFTLIELLIAISISGIMIVAITTGFIVTLRGTATAHDRLVASNGSHTLSTYFTADVESSNPDLTTTDAAATVGCASPPPTSTNVLRLQWSERASSTELRAFSVSYRILASDTDSVPGDDKWQLVRYACSAPGNPATQSMATILAGAPLTDHVVVDELHEPSAPHETKACIGTACTPAQPAQAVVLQAFAALVKAESAPYSYTFSATMRTPEPAPRVLSIDRNGAATVSPTTTSVSWTVTISEAVAGVDPADFALLYTGGLSGASVTSVVPVTNMVYTVSASTGVGQGTMALTVDDNDTIVSVADGDKLGGTGLGNGNYTGGGYTVDMVGPSVVVTKSTGQADPATVLPILFTATFSDNVTGFDSSDVTYGGTAPAGAGITVTGAGKDYVISFNSVPGTGSRTIIPSIAAGRATDSAGFGNSASTPGSDNEVEYDPGAVPPPAVTITDVQLVNGGGGSGKLAKGDKLVVTFSDTMDVSTFCSTWSGNTTNQSIAGDDVVQVTVADGGLANDTFAVTTASGCAFNFSEVPVDLGSTGWVDLNRTFAGTGPNASTIAWNATARTIEITLGTGTGSNPGGVAASKPKFTADADLRSSGGGTITNSPFTALTASTF